MLLGLTSLQLCLFIIQATSLYLLVTWRRKQLNRFPGPLLAALTPAWRVYHAYYNRGKVMELELHEKYGPIVRTAPNVLSFSDPEVIRDVYLKSFHKSDEYVAHAPMVNGQLVFNIFSDPDFARHEKLKRAINHTFTMTNILQYETKINETIDLLISRLNEMVTQQGTGTSVDLCAWLMYFATDVIGIITYSERYGMLEAGKDVINIRDTLLEQNRRVSLLNKWPLLDIVRRRNPLLVWLNKKGYYSATTSMVPHLVGHLSRRLALASSSKELHDLMRDVLESKKQHPEVVTDRAILGIAVALSTAGSDTTAITLSMLLYYLMTTSSAYKRLQQEVDSLFSGNVASATSFTYNDAQQLPYLDSCIKETFRMHPGSSNFQERIVPAEGATICGEFVCSGTIVGCSAVVVNRNKRVFGPNADVWYPERWLEGSTEDRSRMAARLFHFGAGSSQCLGKNIALVEVYKVIPVLLRNFKIELAHPNVKPSIENCNFYHVRNIEAVLTRK